MSDLKIREKIKYIFEYVSNLVHLERKKNRKQSNKKKKIE